MRLLYVKIAIRIMNPLLILNIMNNLVNSRMIAHKQDTILMTAKIISKSKNLKSLKSNSPFEYAIVWHKK